VDERLARVIAALAESGADWAVLSGADSIAYALGYAPPIETGASPFAAGPVLALVGRDGAAGLLLPEGSQDTPRDGVVFRYDGYGRTHSVPAEAPYQEALTSLSRKLGVSGRIATEPVTHPASIDSLLPLGERIDVTPALRRQRMTKTAEEITALRRCAEVAAVGQRRMMESLREGLTELQLFAEIRATMETAVGTRIAVAGDLVSGRKRTAAIGGWPDNRRIARGEAVISDLAPRVDGYWGDSCATVVLGAPTEPQMRLFDAAHKALQCAIAEVRPGLSAQAAHRMIRAVVCETGFDYPHHTGHSIGTAPHEHPRICDDETAVLRAGMVLMIEPGAYDPAIGGARTEWMLHLTETGCVPLAPFPLVASVPGAR
jgi:Xaa-Pro dipeptidase